MMLDQTKDSPLCNFLWDKRNRDLSSYDKNRKKEKSLPRLFEKVTARN